MSLPTPSELKEIFSLSADEKALIAEMRKSIARCLNGEDRRLLLAVGPCSLHDQASALLYGKQLKSLQEEVKDSFILVMRAYFEKPRTRLGWKGALYAPDLEEENLAKGLSWSRETLLKLIQLGVPTATEFLEPLVAPYIEDLICWGFIGSRTSSSQIHRQLASSLEMPVGIKNGPDGSLSSAISSLLSARSSHTFFQIDQKGKVSSKKSPGNPNCHLVLRGADSGPNYDSLSIKEATYHLFQEALPSQLIVDCSHGNSRKNPLLQKEVFFDLLDQIKKGESSIRGLMLESHLEGGHQPLTTEAKATCSVTDPCLDFETTRSMLLEGTGILAEEETNTPPHSL